MASINLSAADVALAREIGGMVSDLLRQDLVFAVLPNGEEHLVKGRALLSRIAAGTQTVHLLRTDIPLPEIEAAVALERALGNDGNLERRRFGNMIYGPSGSA